MKARDVRQLGIDELKGKIRQWKDEAFRTRFKAQTSETKDTSTFRKTRRDIARAYTILAEKMRTKESEKNV
ncbi:MAG: 50S ribosomal protein L29 [Deltaproteobacteria bacterium]|nr:50S ribosomal protein L29 [Deltaproteobacteria bacterium]MBI3293530.1 50S ribosomal protein L29 [Deltaproteobacteria bacterium]